MLTSARVRWRHREGININGMAWVGLMRGEPRPCCRQTHRPAIQHHSSHLNLRHNCIHNQTRG